jgi:TetR/AcrR family transcriptional repressor of nem operon
MSRPTKNQPERGDACTRLLEAARELLRIRGFAATTVDDLCKAAVMTKGAFFHLFKSKESVGVAVLEFWTGSTGVLFENAPSHAPHGPLDRVLAFIAFRRKIIDGAIPVFTYLAGTLVQEIHATAVDIRNAAAASIFGHSNTLESDIQTAIQAHGIAVHGRDAASLARHFQTVLQGSFVLAKAGNDPNRARRNRPSRPLCPQPLCQNRGSNESLCNVNIILVS